ncbi:hypothetical protein [Chryseobacterium sp. 2987]|uniref:hypothetical protein n=1 Tax=Chryseobacterium sp. 2987 TaxID=2817767 RepID=UPI002858B94B|nr:hypothetical protein [Chryseobacterium sp. 2987]MDR6921419.1 putative membrane protein [Chryseobacterium sp. 2987]
MKKFSRILIVILTIISTLLLLAMIIACIAMNVSYWGSKMGNEVSGFYNAAVLMTFFISLPTIALWYILLQQRKQNINSK